MSACAYQHAHPLLVAYKAHDAHDHCKEGHFATLSLCYFLTMVACTGNQASSLSCSEASSQTGLILCFTTAENANLVRSSRAQTPGAVSLVIGIAELLGLSVLY